MPIAFSIMGDSISTFEGCNPEGFDVFYEGARKDFTGVQCVEETWWMQVVNHFGGEVLANGSYSGSMVEGAGFPAGCSQKRVDALGADGRDPDAVIVFMGTNDYGWGGPDAQARAAARATPGVSRVAKEDERVAGHADADAARRFGIAYDAMLARIQEKFPHAQLWCCTLCPGRERGRALPAFAWRLRGVCVREYNDEIRRAASRRGCSLVDFEAYGLDYEAADGTHPTKAGMRQLAAMAIDAMEQQGSTSVCDDGLSLAEAFEGFSLRSDEWCKREGCIGCAHAKGTGNAWYLVCNKRRDLE